MDHLIHFANKPTESWATLAVCGGARPGAVTIIAHDVTCPACRETEAWRKADREARALPLLAGGEK